MVPLPVPDAKAVAEFSVARHDHACVWILHSGRGHKTEEDPEGSARGDPEDSAYVSKAGCVRYRAVRYFRHCRKPEAMEYCSLSRRVR